MWAEEAKGMAREEVGFVMLMSWHEHLVKAKIKRTSSVDGHPVQYARTGICTS